jgi:hypothetical protein
MAAPQLRIGMVHFFVWFCNAKYNTFNRASSWGNNNRFFVIRLINRLQVAANLFPVFVVYKLDRVTDHMHDAELNTRVGVDCPYRLRDFGYLHSFSDRLQSLLC